MLCFFFPFRRNVPLSTKFSSVRVTNSRVFSLISVKFLARAAESRLIEPIVKTGRGSRSRLPYVRDPSTRSVEFVERWVRQVDSISHVIDGFLSFGSFVGNDVKIDVHVIHFYKLAQIVPHFFAPTAIICDDDDEIGTPGVERIRTVNYRNVEA